RGRRRGARGDRRGPRRVGRRLRRRRPAVARQAQGHARDHRGRRAGQAHPARPGRTARAAGRGRGGDTAAAADRRRAVGCRTARAGGGRGGGTAAEWEAEVAGWPAARGAAAAAGELLDLAATVEAGERMLAVAAVTRIGVPAEAAWRESLAVPQVRAYAKVALAQLS